MLFFDLDLGAWVSRPGGTSPPQMTPVLTVGAIYQMPVTFIRGEQLQSVGGGTFYAGIKIKSDFAGTVGAGDATPTIDGEQAVIFSMDLTTTDGKAYFTANPTADTVSAVFVVVATIDAGEFKTPPFEVTLQNDYFSDK